MINLIKKVTLCRATNDKEVNHFQPTVSLKTDLETTHTYFDFMLFKDDNLSWQSFDTFLQILNRQQSCNCQI